MYNIKDSWDQTDQRGFAGSGRSYDRQAAAGGDGQINVTKHGHAVVAEIEIAELNGAADERYILKVGGDRVVGNLRPRGKDFMDTPHGFRAALENVDDPTQGA